MRNNFFNILFGGILIIFLVVGCNVKYKYDFVSGYDDYVSDSANVTIDTLSAVDKSMFAEARIFPGLVDSTDRRIQDTTIMINLAFKYVDPSVLNVTSVPLPIYSTGLYAGPGELIKITVPVGIQGLSVQIGSQTDDLSDLDPAKRAPIVYTLKALFPGLNTVRSPLGGYIWIRRAEKATGGMTKIVFSGVCKSPDFILGVTDPTEWKNEILHSSVPWLELRSDHAVFSVPRSWMKTEIEADGNFADNVGKVMSMWNESFEKDFYFLYGLTAGSDSLKFRAPDFPERVVLDVELKKKAFVDWQDQPIVALNTKYWIDELTDLTSVSNGGSWAVYNVYTDKYSPVVSPWWSDIEVPAAKLPIYKAVERNREDKTTFPRIFPEEEHGIAEMFPKALSYAIADSSKLIRSDANTDYDTFEFLFLVQIGHLKKKPNDENWAFYNYLFQNIRNMSQFDEGAESFYKALCDYYQKSFSMFFDHWGIPISDYVRNEEDSKYDLLNIAQWRYDPISETYKGNTDVNTAGYHYRDVRTSWTAVPYDSLGNKNDEPTHDQGVENMFDGKRSTYWHSHWDGAPAAKLPFYIDIDMKKVNQVDGFYIANGDREYEPRRLILLTSETGDKNGEWTKILEIKPFYECKNPSDGLLPNVKNTEFFDLPQTKDFRYFRIKMTESNYSFKNYDKNGLYDYDKDLNAYIHVNQKGVRDTIWNNPSPYQTIAEFGTYHYKK